MKKYAALLLAATLSISLFPIQPAKAAETDWKSIYKDYIREHFRQAEKNPNGLGSEIMALADLDRDGTPELFGGQEAMVYSPIVTAVTIRDGRIVKLKQTGGGISGDEEVTGFAMGSNALNGMDLYKVNGTGEFKFVGEDYIMGADEQDGCQYEFSLNGDTVAAKQTSCRHLTRVSGSRFEVDLFSVDGKKLTEAEYESQIAAYYSGMTKLDAGTRSSGHYVLYDHKSNRVNESMLNEFVDGYRPPESLVIPSVPADWAKAEVDQAAALNLIPENQKRGYAQNISRADFSKLVVNLLTVKTGKTIDVLLAERQKSLDAGAFTDTTDRTVLAANALGIVGGKGKGLFDPEGGITRQEAAVMLTRTAQVLGKHVSRTGTDFADAQETASWAVEAVAFVSAAADSTNNAKIMGGTGDRTFSPGGFYTRQQAFITVKRLYNAD